MTRLTRGLALPMVLAGAFVLVATDRKVRRGARPQPGTRADALVIFGAAVWPSGPSPELIWRCEHAARGFHAGLAPEILCSGGVTDGRSEAEAMRQLLIGAGVPEDVIIGDDNGLSTRHTVASIGPLAARRGWQSVVVVSTPNHTHRILSECRRQGVRASASVGSLPVLNARASRVRQRRWARRRQHGREVAAVIWYSISAHLPASPNALLTEASTA